MRQYSQPIDRNFRMKALQAALREVGRPLLPASFVGTLTGLAAWLFIARFTTSSGSSLAIFVAVTFMGAYLLVERQELRFKRALERELRKTGGSQPGREESDRTYRCPSDETGRDPQSQG
jgi:hypothetical protein